jgi:L(+)-tartrate dehydratase beta subunit
LSEHHFTTPLTESQARQLRVGDTVLLDGIVWGIRDATLIHMFDRDNPPPVSLVGGALLHTAPNVKKVAGGYEPLCIGTTTSMRMDRFTEGLLRDYGVRAIVGKGGLSEQSSELFQHYGGVYLAIVGGAASVETLQIEAIEAVYFEELMPECLWQLRVNALGPLTVAMDASGGNIYRDVRAQAEARLADIYASLGIAEST